ncbi:MULTISPECIES: hypothetical protein [unclassified Agromyces]|jgi:hypothetical protein|uniref:DUF7144 family membrane protein n=1 Tax=unclassified Agromyces TaxID=2639701 RepID=UPI0007B27B8A|nr:MULTISPECIES: hypothetical protein [unclassified Agromyces]KZE88829.1 hypothetical protein AVP42_03154 [Agromyces sp. NDB4Y10]MCK8608408.1 hypothetical protein [Agromyces sp. C10]
MSTRSAADEVRVTGWIGWGWFAGTILLIAGAIDAIYGFIAILQPDAYFVVTSGTLFLLDVSGWGWWHLILGIVLILVALALFTGATWARVVAVVLASLNAVGHVFLLPAQPWWSLIVIVLDVFVIYALTVHGRELAVRND